MKIDHCTVFTGFHVFLYMTSIIADVFVWAQPYLAAIVESGNIRRNSGPAWSDNAMFKLCSTRKPVNNISAFIIPSSASGFLKNPAIPFVISSCLSDSICRFTSFRPPCFTLTSQLQVVQNACDCPFRDFIITRPFLVV